MTMIRSKVITMATMMPAISPVLSTSAAVAGDRVLASIRTGPPPTQRPLIESTFSSVYV